MFLGADYGIMRLSLGGEPEINEKNATQNNMVPGIGIKFLRNKVESANVLVFGSI